MKMLIVFDLRGILWYTFGMSRVVFKSVVWREGDNFVAQCLDVDVSSFGGSRKEALKNLGEALELYYEDSALPRTRRIKRPVVADVSVG